VNLRLWLCNQSYGIASDGNRRKDSRDSWDPLVIASLGFCRASTMSVRTIQFSRIEGVRDSERGPDNLGDPLPFVNTLRHCASSSRVALILTATACSGLRFVTSEKTAPDRADHRLSTGAVRVSAESRGRARHSSRERLGVNSFVLGAQLLWGCVPAALGRRSKRGSSAYQKPPGSRTNMASTPAADRTRHALSRHPRLWR